MSTQKTISLPKEYVQFAKDTDQTVTAIARTCLNNFIENQAITAPKTGTRDRDGEKHRTTVRLSKRHVNFIDENNVNLSRVIREHLRKQINNQRALQKQENSPGNITPEGSRALITIMNKSRNSTWATNPIQTEWIYWYLTGEAPFGQQGGSNR